MSWNRQPAAVVPAPAPPRLGWWLMAAALAGLMGALLFLLHASQRVPELDMLNVWAFVGSPVVIWLLAFGARAFFYGGALSEHQFLSNEALAAQHDWQSWAHRYLAVHASCVLLPDQLSAEVLIQGSDSLPSRKDQVRRITTLPAKEDRAAFALHQVLLALQSALRLLPAEPDLQVTLLSDIDPDQREALRASFEQCWTDVLHGQPPGTINVASNLSYGWIDETLKLVSSAFELIVVLQLNGDTDYSEGVAALLLSPDSLAQVGDSPVMGGLCRPMPLDTEHLESELVQFFSTQTTALAATGLLADSAEVEGLSGKVIAFGGRQDSALEAQNQWVYESTCGKPGPLAHWLATALAVEMVRHRQQPLLVLTKDQSHWISTVTTGEWA